MPTRQQLLRRLHDLGRHLATRPDAVALLGVGSAGADSDRLDEHSDLDFFVIVSDGAKAGYLTDIGWLAAPCPVAYSFENTRDGRKALYADGIFVEYAVFTVAELAGIGYTAGKVVWRRADAPADLAVPAPREPDPNATVEYQLGEALTNLYVGLKRDARGETLSGFRFIQQYAVDRILTLLALRNPGGRWDPFDPARRAEANTAAANTAAATNADPAGAGTGDPAGAGAPPFAAMMPGYAANRAAAAAILDWLEPRFPLDPVIVAAIRGQLSDDSR